MNKIRYLLPVLITAFFVLMAELGYFYFIFILLLFGNVLNFLWGEFNPSEIRAELKSFYSCKVCIFFKRCSALFLIGFLIWGISFIDRSGFSLGQVALFTFGAGLISGCFIVTLAHDTLHSHKTADRILASGLLIVSGIPYLAADHIHSHHKKVGLEDDASTAKINQNFYHYFLTVFLDRVRNSFSHSMDLPSYLSKKILRQNVLLLILLLGFWTIVGFVTQHPLHTLVFIIGQAIIAYILYELINYIQHYGLRRRSPSDQITLHHSWNCYYKYTNFILFMLPMHSVHHVPKSRRKIKTEQLKNGPKMPYLYFIMVLLALIPPLWFAKMNPLVNKINA